MVKVLVTNRTKESAEISVNGGAYGAFGVWYNGEGEFKSTAANKAWGGPSMRHETFTIKVKIDGQEQPPLEVTAGTWNKKHGDACHVYFTRQGLFHENGDELVRFKTYVPFFLASTTDGYFDEARKIVFKAGGENATGVRDDYVNGKVLQNIKSEQEGYAKWKHGMMIKWSNVMENFAIKYPDSPVIALCLTGGPACNWERDQCTDPEVVKVEKGELHFREKYPNVRCYACTDPTGLQSFIDRGLPMDECN
jgi:hypothetical protein